MFLQTIRILNFRKTANTVIELNKGVNAFVGENNSGKTAIIDAIRLCLGARSYEMNGYITEDDFNDRNQKIDIQCKFVNLTDDDISKFLQYLTYEDNQVNLYVNLVVEKGSKRINPKKSTGKNYDGDSIEQELLDDIVCTYLKPLRDAESELSAKKYSRIFKILESKLDVKNQLLSDDELEALQNAIKKAVNEALKIADGVDKFKEIETLINKHYFSKFLLANELKNILTSKLIPASSLDIRSILEKFELSINGSGRQGLGYNNILFMAAEMLLLEEHGGILLIEEPEAHLHPQLQLCFMQALEEIATEKNIQVIISTHSVTLASKIPVEQLILVADGQGFSLAQGKTKLISDDYKFLSKFLDATKANLFFARGVLVVEGDSENILLPSIAKVIDKDFTRHGVSIVKIGHKDNNPPYVDIFKRKDENDNSIPVKVCCIGDTDDYNATSSEKTDDGVKYVKLEKTFEYYLMTKSDVFKQKIFDICYDLKGNRNASDKRIVYENREKTEKIEVSQLSTAKEIYELCFIKKDVSKTEVALRLAIAIDNGNILATEVSKLTEVIAAITYVTTDIRNK